MICEGHPAGPFDPMGETVYCDGTCSPENRILADIARIDSELSITLRSDHDELD